MGWSQEELIMKSGFLVKEKGEAAASASRGAGAQLIIRSNVLNISRHQVQIVFLCFNQSTNTRAGMGFNLSYEGGGLYVPTIFYLFFY